MRQLIIGLSLIFYSTLLFAQNKDEHEVSVEPTAFPEVARALISELPKDLKKKRFYKETDGSHQSFELKFKYNKYHYSLEFSIEGVIEDIEKTIKFKSIAEGVKHNIETYFMHKFTKSKIIKCQEQYNYTKGTLPITFIDEILVNRSNAAANFEIIAEVKEDSKRTIREFTFDSSGEFLNFRILNPTSYEYVLY